MEESELKELRRRVDRAIQYRRRWDMLLRDVYDYIIPYRNDFSSAVAGTALTDKVFDSTAIDAAFRFAGRMQQDLTPPFQPFFKLVAGPALRVDEQKRKEMLQRLEAITDQVTAAISTSGFHMGAHEMYLDLFAGTGAMLLLEGDDAEPVRAFAVPLREVSLELGPFGNVIARHWLKAFPACQLEQMWPKGTFSDTLRQKMKDEPEAMIGICQSTCWCPKKRKWELTVFEHAVTDSKQPSSAGSSCAEAPIWTESFQTSPWITPRFFVVPGEPYGRGPAMIGLPHVKTLNKAVELDLKAASLALYGIWASRDDDFNIDTARFQGGSVWNVSSTGGPLGPSLVKLDVPGKYDLARIITEEQRMQVKRAMFDDTLPPDAGAVRSATEIMGRMKKLNLDLGGVLGRLTLEIVQPVVQRVIEILFNKKIITSSLTIDQLTVGLKVVSPIADAQAAAKARKTVDYAQMIAMLQGPQQVQRYLRDSAFVELGRGIGVEERHITDDGERKAFDQQAAQAAQAENQTKLGAELIKAASAGGIRPEMDGAM